MGSELKELKALLSYMIKHNDEHAGELKDLAEKAKSLGNTVAYDELIIGVKEMKKANERLKNALTKLKEWSWIKLPLAIKWGENSRRAKGMCLAKVYLKRNNNEEFVIANVTNVDISDGRIIMTTILKEKKELQAAIRMIDFENSNVFLEGDH
jgi:predicted RNA-binding protein